jgi:hypothetical protein
MIILTYDNSEYTLDWSDLSTLREFIIWQHGISYENSDKIFLQQLTGKIQWYCDTYLRFIPKNTKKIISVGSGASIFELILSKYCTDSTIFLLDKSEIIPGEGDKNNSFSETNSQGFYNSWKIVHDAIKTSNLNEDSFVFLDPVDEWETDIDVIMSTASWCWHYPFEFYADKLFKSLKIGGSLILEIQNTPNFRDIPKIISEMLGSDPIYQQRYSLIGSNFNPNQRRNVDVNNEIGGEYAWIRKK